MKNQSKSASTVAGAAVIAAMYAALTTAQQLILPGSASLTVQFRIAEALTLLCIFMPSAVPGLTVGCFIANIFCSASVIPVDIASGTLATLLSCLAVRFFGNIRIKGLPVLSAVMPALFNGVIIGLELEIFYIEGKFELTGFLMQAGCVALGELAVCLLAGLPFFKYLEKKKLTDVTGGQAFKR
ncbi:MAG: QueT transporter family protein [Clostridia bacterium]|nr:QueT transporter family protein [Clostridia bacterium]